MKLISWNCYGMGNAAAVRGLLDLHKREDPDILFLEETKMDNRKIENFGGCWDSPTWCVNHVWKNVVVLLCFGGRV
jgi:exonuclease III